MTIAIVGHTTQILTIVRPDPIIIVAVRESLPIPATTTHPQLHSFASSNDREFSNIAQQSHTTVLAQV